MKELIQFSFDFFAYVIPGLFVIFSISLIAIPIDTFQEVKYLTVDFDGGLATVLVIVAYTIGFCIYPIGRYLYKTIGFKLWKNRIKDDSNGTAMSVPTKYALLRHHSPTNFKYVESWNIYCAMSHNLMVACLIYCVVALVKTAQGNNIEFWAGTFVLGLVLFFILTHRAITYFHWAAYDINATISSLNLKEHTEE
jgi:hypothetical protein